ncbi:CPBP family glutamic-type intramembrane protease [Paragemmobacter ruber]|uniref:CPBP family intramembrane metalloprotease n=1 Tax=Paragemmobacter ruber TaxID=1985673 RepID=A0ABW9Y2F9_9RHOB|nr:CPBP family glutamic-type intramembrane protease [Rhodobacter ruber]NBE06683.1 CPBP family intramembrane metalloprotease [Rhodobacter ruber]
MTYRPYPIRALAAVFLGLPGVIALPLLAPLPPGIPPLAVMANPAILLILMACAGAWAAPRVGLRSAVILGTPLPWRALAVWAGVGLAAGLGVAILDHATAPLWPPDGAATLRADRAVGDLVLGVLYGGLTEEVLLRWGVLSLISLGLARFLPRGAALWGAVALAALAFALAHLPALALTVDAPTPPLLLRTILWNLLLGLVYGAALLRHGLEAALLAHAATHLGFALAALSPLAAGASA